MADPAAPAEPGRSPPAVRRARVAIVTSCVALAIGAGVPHWTEWRHRPAGLTRGQAVELAKAQAAINLGSQLWRAQERRFAGRGDYVTDSTRLGELGPSRYWPEGLELGGLGPAPRSGEADDAGPGWRLVFTTSAPLHWCIHWTHRGLESEGCHLPTWMRPRLGFDG